MNRLLSAIVAIICAGGVRAQTVELRLPAEDDILAHILPHDSPHCYEPLFARYMQGDETLTDDDYFYLYYGYAYQSAYDAHKELPGQSTIAGIFGRKIAPSPADARAIIEAAEANMSVDPFSPSNINMLTFACELAGDTLGARVNSRRFQGIVRAITRSGTGLREKSPWHILRFSHADDIIASRGLTITNRQVRSRDVEYIQFDRNSAGIRGYFFDFSRIYWRPYDGQRVTKKKRWLFNGTPI